MAIPRALEATDPLLLEKKVSARSLRPAPTPSTHAEGAVITMG